MHKASALFAAAAAGIAFVGATALAAFAQTAPAPVYDNPYCGAYQNGVWVANTNCGPEAASYGRIARVSGTIIKVQGHLVTLQQSDRQIVINDQPALDMQATGRVAVGRQVVAYGYWRAGTFYATDMTNDQTP